MLKRPAKCDNVSRQWVSSCLRTCWYHLLIQLPKSNYCKPKTN